MTALALEMVELRKYLGRDVTPQDMIEYAQSHPSSELRKILFPPQRDEGGK